MSFRLATIADTHLGYSTGRQTNRQGINLRVADGYLALNRIISEIIESDVDAVLLCGDLFHTPHPEIRDIVFAQNQFKRLWKANIPIYILAGNHDVNDVQDSISAARVVSLPEHNIFSNAEPYVQYEIADGINLHMVSHHLYSTQQETMKDVEPIPGTINIFATHGSIINPLTDLAIRNGSPREIIIPDKILNQVDWDYRILGHIHERGFTGSEDGGVTDTANLKTYYNGSTIRRGFSDKDVALGRGWTLWEISENGLFVPEFKTISQRPQYDFETIDAKDMLPSEVSQQIIENLKNTQVNGNNFDPATAPILRQTVSNLSSAKYQALDLKTITEQSQHAMTWSIKQTNIETLDSRGNAKSVSLESGHDGRNMLEIYEDWLPSSNVLENASEDLREKVESQTKEFIKLGQEIVLEDV